MFNTDIYCSGCCILNSVTLDDFSLNSMFEKLTFEVYKLNYFLIKFYYHKLVFYVNTWKVETQDFSKHIKNLTS